MSSHPFSTLFQDAAAWQVFASGQARGRVRTSDAPDGKRGLRLEYDFHGGGGFVVIRRVMPMTLPETFAIGFQLRGQGPPNHFEFKVAGSGGADVWRYQRTDFAIPGEWTGYRIRERDLPFAWGPAGGGSPSRIEAIEFVIAAGPGGNGWIELCAPSFEDQTFRQPRAVEASSEQPGFPAAAVFADGASGWRAAVKDARPVWQADFGRPVRFGGLVIGWPDGLPAREFAVEISSDGQDWSVVHRGQADLGPLTHIATPDAEAVFLRIRFADAKCAALRALSLRPDAFSHTPNEFIHAVAKDFPRGWYPRYWHREQSYWTPVGSPEGKRRALINEEGMVEVDEAGFSLEPVLLTSDGIFTWAEAETRLSMGEGGLPFPAVKWTIPGIELEILPWVDGKGATLTLQVTYRVRCSSPGVRLVVAVRPFQVNPPWQAFRNLGGRSPIHGISPGLASIVVEGRRVSASPRPRVCGAATFEQGGVHAFLAAGQGPPSRKLKDESGLASAAMIWEIPDGVEPFEVTVSVPYFGRRERPARDGRSRAINVWRRALGTVRWSVPEIAAPAFDAFRTAAAHILINRDGPAIQPGPRRYTRSWVRDCVIMGAALAKAGLPHALDEFINWYARFQREDGFVPCVVDRDGVDWLVEHDSHGQFLWGIREVFRASGDPEFLSRLLPHARKAADFLIELRAQRMTGEFRGGKRTADFGLLPESVSLEDEDTLDTRSEFFGLLPESASHEGYLAHPVHSYWDDFWGIRGLQAAAELAEAAGFPDEAARWFGEAEAFQDDLLRSIGRVIREKNLNYIPGSVEWADFDPTATSNAIAMLDFADVLPAGPLHTMLDTYLDGHRRKHGGLMEWNNYTAYEIRIIGAFVRLGKREIASELLEFFLSDRRPREWNQWPEISWKNPRSPGHLGDVPHTWIAAEYLLALASMVASEREAAGSLVLAAGLPWSWISAEGGFAVKGLPTRFGSLDFRIRTRGTTAIEVKVGGSLTLPPGGLTIVPPLPPDDPEGSADEIVIPVGSLPFRAVIPLRR